jgi:hypothetical protein
LEVSDSQIPVSEVPEPEETEIGADSEHVAPELAPDDVSSPDGEAVELSAPQPRHVILPEAEPSPASPKTPPMHHGMSPTLSAARKKGRFSRKSGAADHDHDYRESKTVGGITRRVCAVCGHVSFASEDVYQGWS